MSSEDLSLAKLNVTVTSLANPSGPTLLAAREVIAREGVLQEAFLRARDEKWPSTRLVEALEPLLADKMGLQGDTVEELARYLVDEYEQVGDAILLVSRETGKPIARVTDEDMWLPAPVPRSDGSMAPSPYRLRPEIEGFLIHRMFSEARDEKLHNEMALKVIESTGLLRPENDRRLLSVTRRGRKTLLELIRAELPELLPSHATGAAQRFLDCFSLVPIPLEGRSLFCIESTAEAHVRFPVQDPKTFNLKHDVLSRMLPVIAALWARDIARMITLDIPPSGGSASTHVWVSPPEYASSLVHPSSVVVAPGASPIGVSLNAGHLFLDRKGIVCESREVHDRWEVLARIPFKIWVDPDGIVAAPVTHIERSFHAEVVR